MRIAVAGATGHIGALTVAALERQGHDIVRISRSLGVDLKTGDGLDDALTGVEAVIDTTNAAARERSETVAYLGTLTRNLLEAEQRAGVGTTCCSRSSASTGSRATPTTPASGSRNAW
jgi:nucleoside-diphosphate-sugar epimerase